MSPRLRALVRRTLSYFMPWAVAVLVLVAYFHHTETRRELYRVEDEDRSAVRIGATSLNFALHQISADLLTLAGFADLIDALESGNDPKLGDLTREYLNFAREHRIYDQIRWIDETGRERLRVNYDAGGARAVPGRELQNKSDRYYFAGAMALRPGEIYVSPLDLNVEGGQLDNPPKPTIRIATPVADSHGRRRGILIVNYLAREMLERFTQAMAPVRTRNMLLNRDGYWLSSPNPGDEWGFMFGRADSLATRAPAAWAVIGAGESGQFEQGGDLWTYVTVHPLRELDPRARPMPAGKPDAAGGYRWKVVVLMSAQALRELRLQQLPQTLAVGGLALLIVFLGSWRLAAARLRQIDAEEALRRSNLDLEQTVDERTRQLRVEVSERQMAERRYRESSEQYQKMLATMHDAYWMFDPDGVLLDVNGAACTLLGYGRDELLKLRVADLEAQSTPAAVAAHIRQIGVRGHDRFETRHRRRDGELLDVEVSVSYLGEYQRYVALIRDISRRKQLEAERRLAALVLESTDEGVVICDARFKVLSVNPACERITGFAAAEIVGRRPNRLAAIGGSLALQVFVTDLMRRLQRDGSWRGEVPARRKSGEVYPVWLNISVVRDGECGIAYYVGVFSDITSIKESQERLAFLAHHDALTGLPNRLLFHARLEHAIERARRDASGVAVLFIDLDHFKEVNDSLGHAVGDDLLRDIAGAMGAGLRAEDTLARLGGDEFVILLERVGGRAGVEPVLDKIEQVFPWNMKAGDQIIGVTASVGVAIFPADGEDATSLVRRADAAMYAAKGAGRCCHRFAAELVAGVGADREADQLIRNAPSATSQ